MTARDDMSEATHGPQVMKSAVPDLARLMSGDPIVASAASRIKELTQRHHLSLDEVLAAATRSGEQSTAPGESQQGTSTQVTAQLTAADYQRLMAQADEDEQKRLEAFSLAYLPDTPVEDADPAGAAKAAGEAQRLLEAHAEAFPGYDKVTHKVFSRIKVKTEVGDCIRQVVQCLYFPKAPYFARLATDTYVKALGPIRALATLYTIAMGGGTLSKTAMTSPIDPQEMKEMESVAGKLNEVFTRFQHSHGILLAKFVADNPEVKSLYPPAYAAFASLVWMQLEADGKPHPKYGYMIKTTNQLAKNALAHAIAIASRLHPQAARAQADLLLPDGDAMVNRPNYAADVLGEFMVGAQGSGRRSK